MKQDGVISFFTYQSPLTPGIYARIGHDRTFVKN